MGNRAQPASVLRWHFSRDHSGPTRCLPGLGGKRPLLDYEFFPCKDGQIRFTTVRVPSNSVTYKYDRHGRTTNIPADCCQMRYHRDPMGHQKAIERSIATSIVYRYNALGRLKGYSVGDDVDVEYDYDFLGRIAAIHTPVGSIRYTFLPGQGQIIRMFPNCIRTIWNRQADGQLATITHFGPDGRVMAEFTYSYRPNRSIAKIRETFPRIQKTLNFEFDLLRRLVSVASSDGTSWDWNYDACGNRTREIGGGQSTVYTYDGAGLLSEVNSAVCAHDNNGNLTFAKLERMELRYAFNENNRLCEAGHGQIRYDYDGDGTLIARTVGGERTLYLADPSGDEWRPLAEFAPSGSARFYVHDDAGPLAVVEGEHASFFLHDNNGSIRGVSDASGEIIEWRDYSPFGVPQSPSVVEGLLPGFSGMFWDPAAAVYLARQRAYSPRLGRFLQADPLHQGLWERRKELSAYVYCGNNPVNNLC